MPYTDDYTPDFMTPNQVAANRGYAKALMEGGYTPISGHSGDVTAVSPLSPIVQMTSALYGRSLMNQAGEQERSSMIAPNRAATSGPIPGEPQQAGYSINPPGSPGSSGALGYANATKSQESGGNYNAVGPTTHDGDRAYGAYQVKGSNIGPWTQEVLGTTLTPQQFLASKEAQDLVYQHKFSEYVSKYGPEGAARAWYGGEGNVNSPNAKDLAHPNAPTVGQYGQNFAQAMQFAGPGASAGPTAPDAQAATAMALARPGGQPTGPGAPGMGLPGQVPAGGGQGNGQIVPSGFFPQRQQVSREQFISVMSNPYASPELKQYISNSYYGQYQPISMEGPFGHHIVRDAQGHQMDVPPSPHWGEVKAGDVSVPRAQYPGLGGEMHTMGAGGGPVSQPPQGAGSNIPTGGPQVPAGGGYNIGGGDGDIAAGRSVPVPHNPDAKTTTPGPRSEAAPEGKPVQVASLETGTVSDAPAPGILGTPPPSAGPALATQPPKQPTAGGVRTAQAGGALTDMSDQELANYSQERTLAGDFGKKDIEEYGKKFGTYQDAGNKAITGMPQIQTARAMIEDPRMIQGPWADFKQTVNNAFTALTGNERTTAATTLRDAFEKIRSGGILNQMRETLAGLGQVRLAEINLLGQATASAGNTLGANRAILTLAERSSQQMADIGQITGLYRQGYRWDNNGQLLTTQGNDRPSLAGQEQAVRTYLLKHPLLSPDEIKQYKEFLSLPEDRKKSSAAAKPQQYKVPDGFSTSPPASPAGP